MREEWGHVLSALVRSVRDLDLAEDVLQDALVKALDVWPRQGIPDEPRAWLLQTARRRAIDRFRREAVFRSKQTQLRVIQELSRSEVAEEPTVDERLSLIFLCCHPALASEARVALTLRTLGGLTTVEIARAFLVPDTTMGQRLVRAKAKIKAAAIPFRVPPRELWPERLDSVLSVLYLIFNEGYRASRGRDLTRADLCEEAIRLARILAGLAPHEPEAAGLLALMLLHDARRPARTDRHGHLVTLEDQDRSRWSREKIAEGDGVLRDALSRGDAGPYQLQAAISAVHATAPSHAETDWREIVLLYRRLHEAHPNWVVALNLAVAVSFAEGAAAGLAILTRVAAVPDVERYQPFHAARADMLRRDGRFDEAAAAYARARDLSDNDAERAFLERRRREVTAG